MSTIEGSIGYYVDGILLVDGMRVLFTADTDLTVNNKIYTVKIITITSNGVATKQIALQEATDTTPNTNDVVFSSGTSVINLLFVCIYCNVYGTDTEVDIDSSIS